MEKARLLEELSNLKRMIINHKTSHSVGSKSSGNSLTSIKKPSDNCVLKRKVIQSVPIEKHKVTIFLNPHKMRAIQSSKQLKASPKITKLAMDKESNTNKNDTGKVFVNPNFQKSNLELGIQTGVKKLTDCKINWQNKSNINQSCSMSKKGLICNMCKKEVTTQTHQCHNENPCNFRTNLSIQANEEHLPQIRCKHSIFINPVFNKEAKLKNDSQIVLTDESVRKKPCTSTKSNEKDISDKPILITKSLSKVNCSIATSNSKQESSIVNLCEKRKILLNKYKTEERREMIKEESSDMCKRRKVIQGDTIFAKKIFLNPTFEKKMQTPTTIYNNNLEQTVTTGSSKSNILKSGIKDFPHPVSKLCTDRNQSCRLTVLSFPDGCLNGPERQKCLVKRVVNPRRDTKDTDDMSVNVNKLISKRKVGQMSCEKIVKTNLKQPLLLTKTKLVRYCPPKKELNNLDSAEKTKRLCKINLQCWTSDKVNKLRRQSSVNSVKNLSSNTAPKSTLVTRVKSKNGKSLKLIRKSLDSSKQTLEWSKVKSINTMQKRKFLLKQQASMQLLCTQAKWKENQFSKINVPVKKRVLQSISQSKYVYKNKDATPRKVQTKCTRFDKKRKSKPTIIQDSVKSSDKNKFVHTKYSLVRKLSFSLDNRTRKSCKTPNKCTPNKILPRSSKRKWKLQNNLLKNSFKRKQLSIVNIEGVFYSCSRTSLTRNKPTLKRSKYLDLQKQNKGHLLQIHGQKYQLADNGQTLTCLDKRFRRKRIDIGGVTFIASSSGTSLTRTNYHTARSILAQAKQKSINLLTRKLRKNYEPCLFYHRLGRCSGKDKGTCVRQHDPKYVAVCKKFVQGLCTDSQCLLSHVLSCHNMPTCQHYLAGNCGRDNCPYPHIKVNDSAPLCLDFLKGYCLLGDQCTKRHIEICPAFEKGTCPRGKYCPYPHPKSKSNQNLKKKLVCVEKKSQPPKDPEPVSTCSLRYFEDLNLQKEIKIQLNEPTVIQESDFAAVNEEERNHSLKNRPKLGRLPSFIPFSIDESQEDNSVQLI